MCYYFSMGCHLTCDSDIAAKWLCYLATWLAYDLRKCPECVSSQYQVTRTMCMWLWGRVCQHIEICWITLFFSNELSSSIGHSFILQKRPPPSVEYQCSHTPACKVRRSINWQRPSWPQPCEKLVQLLCCLARQLAHPLIGNLQHIRSYESLLHYLMLPWLLQRHNLRTIASHSYAKLNTVMLTHCYHFCTHPSPLGEAAWSSCNSANGCLSLHYSLLIVATA